MKRFTLYYPLISFPLLLTFFLPTVPSTPTVLHGLVCDSCLIRFAYRNTGEGFYRSIANLPGSATLRDMSLPPPAVIDCLPTVRRGGASWDTPFHDWTVQSQCGVGLVQIFTLLYVPVDIKHVLPGRQCSRVLHPFHPLINISRVLIYLMFSVFLHFLMFTICISSFENCLFDTIFLATNQTYQRDQELKL